MTNFESKPVALEVYQEPHIAQARRTAERMARMLGFSQVTVCHISTSVSELASNLCFHTTRGGSITLTPIRDGRIGVQVESRDAGPGIVDIEQVMQDGYSTNGGLGCGLPGVRRLMDEFEMTSTLGSGTRIVTRIWKRADRNNPSRAQ